MDAAVVIKRRCRFIEASFTAIGHVAEIERDPGDIDPKPSAEASGVRPEIEPPWPSPSPVFGQSEL
jgi:hypothetical protein